MVRRAARRTIENEGRGGDEIASVRLTHPDRVLYADQGITKRELALYYKAIADWILPQVENRPLTLLRGPEGYGKECFYQRHTRDVVHDAIHSISIRDGKASAAYLYIDSLSGLIALVQMGVLEIHTWGSRKDRLENSYEIRCSPRRSYATRREAIMMKCLIIAPQLLRFLGIGRKKFSVTAAVPRQKSPKVQKCSKKSHVKIFLSFLVCLGPPNFLKNKLRGRC